MGLGALSARMQSPNRGQGYTGGQAASEGLGQAGNWAEIWDLQVRGLYPSCKFACEDRKSVV